jgi:thermitase
MVLIRNIMILLALASFTSACCSLNECDNSRAASLNNILTDRNAVDVSYIDDQRIVSSLSIKERAEINHDFVVITPPEVKPFQSRYTIRSGSNVAVTLGKIKYFIHELYSDNKGLSNNLKYHAVSTHDDVSTYHPIYINSLIVRVSSTITGDGERLLLDDMKRIKFISEARSLGMPYNYVLSLSVKGGNDLAEVIGELSKSKFVDLIEFDYMVFPNIAPNDPGFAKQWALEHYSDFDIDATASWNRAQNCDSSAVGAIAVIDSGVEVLHPDLASNIWINQNETNNGIDDDKNGYIDDIYGYDFVKNSGLMIDPLGHGTHVAGIIGAQGNNGIGITGLCWKSKIMALRFLGDDGHGKTSDAIRAINYAVQMGAKVLNNSWGGGAYTDALKEAITIANNNDALFVAAAGNNSANTDVTPYYPQSYDVGNIISVANLTSSGSLNSSSNYGEKSVDIAAPGTTILSTYISHNYAYQTGTSMAAPYVSAYAALLMTETRFYNVRDLVQAILSSTKRISNLLGKVKTGGTLDASYQFKNFNPITGSPPVGSVIAYGGLATTSEIDGLSVAKDSNTEGTWLICSGQQPRLKQADYPELFKAIGYAWTPTSEITSNPGYFRIPALDGYFLRAVDYLNVLQDGARTPIGSLSPEQVGSMQDHQVGNHKHTGATGKPSNIQDQLDKNSGGNQFHAAHKNHTHAFTTGGVESIDSETRPKNIYINYIIRVK